MNEVRQRETNRKLQLTNIAITLFAQKGYRQTKVSDIVSEAGVAQGTFYWYFKSKESLAIEILETNKTKLLEVISKGYRKTGGNVQDMVRASAELFEDLFWFARENRYYMEIMLTGGGGDELIRQAAFDTRLAMELKFRDNMHQAVKLGMLPASMNIELRAAFLMSLLEGTISRWLFGPVMEDSDIRQLDVSQLAWETARFEFYGLAEVHTSI